MLEEQRRIKQRMAKMAPKVVCGPHKLLSGFHFTPGRLPSGGGIQPSLIRHPQPCTPSETRWSFLGTQKGPFLFPVHILHILASF